MKTYAISLVLSIVLLGMLPFSINATTLGTIKGKKNVKLQEAVGNSIVKYISSSPLENFEGNSQDIRGQFILDADNLEQSSGQISLDVKSMKSGLTKRDEHMYGKDWLDAGKFPTIAFDLKKISGIAITKSDNTTTEMSGTAEGNFTLHGVSKYIKANLSIKYVKESEATKKRAPGDFALIKTSFKVSLKEFGIAGRGDIIGSKVGESIEIEANLYGASSN